MPLPPLLGLRLWINQQHDIYRIESITATKPEETGFALGRLTTLNELEAHITTSDEWSAYKEDEND